MKQRRAHLTAGASYILLGTILIVILAIFLRGQISPLAGSGAAQPRSSNVRVPSPQFRHHLANTKTAKTSIPQSVHVRGLHVVGAQLVDGLGRRIRLLGVNRSGSEFKCIQLGTPDNRGWGIFDGPIDLPVATAMAKWHANAVRIPLNEDCWLGINGVSPKFGGHAYRAAINQFVKALHRAGLYAILDLHWSAPGSAPAASQQPLPDADHSLGLWRSVATMFKSDPAVAFDVYNEPFLYTSYVQTSGQDFWACWRNGCWLNQYLTGGNPFTIPEQWRTAGMQQLVNTIRSTGAKNLVILGGLDWANDVSQWQANAPHDPARNVAASWHSYPAEGCASESCWNRVVAPLARHIPVVVGETGDNVCSTSTWISRFLPWADKHNLSYLGWTWNPWQDCKNILIKNYAGAPTAHYGQYFHDRLRALASRQGSKDPAPALPLPKSSAGPHHSTRLALGSGR